MYVDARRGDGLGETSRCSLASTRWQHNCTYHVCHVQHVRYALLAQSYRVPGALQAANQQPRGNLGKAWLGIVRRSCCTTQTSQNTRVSEATPTAAAAATQTKGARAAWRAYSCWMTGTRCHAAAWVAAVGCPGARACQESAAGVELELSVSNTGCGAVFVLCCAPPYPSKGRPRRRLRCPRLLHKAYQ